MATIEITSNVRATESIDVDFPLYRKHVLDNSIIYSKTESAEKEIDIQIKKNEDVIEIEICKPSFFSSKEYVLGEGQYKSNQAEFEMAVASLRVLVDKALIHGK